MRFSFSSGVSTVNGGGAFVFARAERTVTTRSIAPGSRAYGASAATDSSSATPPAKRREWARAASSSPRASASSAREASAASSRSSRREDEDDAPEDGDEDDAGEPPPSRDADADADASRSRRGLVMVPVPAGGKCPGTRPYLPPTWTRPRKLRGLGRSRVGERSGETKRQETARSARPRDARGPASSAPIASDATSEPNAFGPNEDYYYERTARRACAQSRRRVTHCQRRFSRRRSHCSRQLMRPDLDWENLLVEFHSGFFAASRSETLTGH